MNSTKLFNKSYFVQNLLKSKAIVALIIGIIPILNAIFLMAMESTIQGTLVADLTEISILNVIGMYVLPVVLSLCLFGYVFKKKSVDFINSMPLTRKTIYFTNAIGGILLIIAMMLINTILMFIESLIFSKLLIPFSLIIDYFIVWTITYIFVFTVANIAVSISGNPVTMLVATMVILLFVPFMHNYVTGFNGSIYGNMHYKIDTTGISQNEKNIDLAVEKINEDIDYTLPYNYISALFKGEITTYSIESNIKMIVLSIVYFVTAMYLFEKRRMEVNEVSFKSAHAHMILKCLTLIVIGAFAMILMEQTSNAMIKVFIIGLIIAYYFIYDLITTKSIRSIKLGIIYFIAVALISVGLYNTVDHFNNYDKNKALKAQDISAVSLNIEELNYTGRYYNYKTEELYLDNEELLTIIKENISRPQEYKPYDMNMIVKLKNGQKFRVSLYLEIEEYNKIVDIALKDERYIKEYKDIDYSNVYSMTVSRNTLTKEELQKALTSLKSIIDKADLRDVYSLPNTYTTIDLELYTNHKRETYYIPISVSEELFKEYVKIANDRTARYAKLDLLIYDIRIFNYEKTIVSGYERIPEAETIKYLREYIKDNPKLVVDIKKPMLRVTATVNTHDLEVIELEYFTNNVLEYIEFVNNIIGQEVI